MSADCTCNHYVLDYSDPDRYHPENVDREDNPACPVHGQDAGRCFCCGETECDCQGAFS